MIGEWPWKGDSYDWSFICEFDSIICETYSIYEGPFLKKTLMKYESLFIDVLTKELISISAYNSQTMIVLIQQ